MAVGLGARVTIIDLSIDRLRYLDDIFHGRVVTEMSNSYNIAKWVARADLLISSVLIPGAKTPILVTEDMIKTMKKVQSLSMLQLTKVAQLKLVIIAQLMTIQHLLNMV